MKIILPVIVVLIILLFTLFSTPSETITNASPTGKTIVCFGDSLTQGVGAKDNMDYPSQLSRLINKDIINLGQSGDTTKKALARLESLLEKDPRIVLITIGGNDLKNGIKKERAFENLAKIVAGIQAQGALVILGGVNPPLMNRGYGQAYVDFAKENGVVLIPNILAGIMGNRKLMSDHIHPNTKGYSIMAKYFAEAIKPYL